MSYANFGDSNCSLYISCTCNIRSSYVLPCFISCAGAGCAAAPPLLLVLLILVNDHFLLLLLLPMTNCYLLLPLLLLPLLLLLATAAAAAAASAARRKQPHKQHTSAGGGEWKDQPALVTLLAADNVWAAAQVQLSNKRRCASHHVPLFFTAATDVRGE
jgi:hypothetical protein